MGTMKDESAFSRWLPLVLPHERPRKLGQLELRDRALGMNQIQDIVENLGEYIDTFKWTTATQRLVRPEKVKRKNEYLRQHGIGVSTGGMLERVAHSGERAVHGFLDECAELGFTMVEVSTGISIMSLADKTRLIKAVARHNLVAKPEVAMTYGAGASKNEIYKANSDRILHECEACLEAGAPMVMIEEEGIFQYVEERNADLAYALVRKFGLERLMFEASDKETFNWLIAQFGPDVNLFTDPAHATSVIAYRTGIWGMSDTWGRVAGFRGEDADF
jgi:phosphosulfolactate synthase (CoM biosynthesis protein A)